MNQVRSHDAANESRQNTATQRRQCTYLASVDQPGSYNRGIISAAIACDMNVYTTTWRVFKIRRPQTQTAIDRRPIERCISKLPCLESSAILSRCQNEERSVVRVCGKVSHTRHASARSRPIHTLVFSQPRSNTDVNNSTSS